MNVVHCLDVLNIGGIQEMGFNLYKKSKHRHSWWVQARGGSFEAEMLREGMAITTDPGNEKPDVLVGHTVGGWTYDEKFEWARKRGAKTVEVMHSNANSPTRPELVDVFIGVSQRATEMGARRFPRVECIYPPIIAEFKERRREKVQVVGRLSRLAPEKRPDAFVEVARDFPDLHFVLAGDGPMRAELEARAPKNLQMVGWVRDFPAFYYHVDLFLFSTRDECNCVSVAMAQMAGVPVVCQDTPALRETTGGHALLVNDPGSSVFCEALAAVKANYRSALQVAGQGKVFTESRYGLVETIGKWDALIDDLTKEKT